MQNKNDEHVIQIVCISNHCFILMAMMDKYIMKCIAMLMNPLFFLNNTAEYFDGMYAIRTMFYCV